jgi:DNA-directed RNA polymerase specialized sigma24 family protein
MGSPEDRLKWGLLWLGGAVGKRLQDPEAIAEVIQAASLRLVRALDRGVDVRSMEAFLARIAKEEVARYKRDLGRRSRWLSELGEAVERLAAPAHAVAALSMDALMDRLKRLLPPRCAGWLVDRIPGATDLELSRRDNVSLAAIRKRWRLLEDRVADSAFLARIFDIPVTKRGAEESLGSGADPSVQPLPPPPPPSPLPPPPKAICRKDHEALPHGGFVVRSDRARSFHRTTVYACRLSSPGRRRHRNRHRDRGWLLGRCL